MGLLGDWIAAKRADYRVRANAGRITEALLDASTLPYVDTDLIKWFGSGGQSRRRTPVPLSVARDTARAMTSGGNSHARNVRQQITNFTVGRGFAVKLSTPAEQQRWDDLAELMRWNSRAPEIVRRVIDDGEALLRRFGAGQVRFVEPENLSDPAGVIVGVPPDGVWRDGVCLRESDAEDVLGFGVLLPPGRWEFVPTTDILHIKDPFSSLASPRGWPFMYDARTDLDAYEDFVRWRGTLNKIRAAFAFIRRHKGSTRAQVSAMIDRIKDGTIQRSGGETAALTQMLPGIGIDADDRTEYEFPKANIAASDAADDGRAMRLMVCAAFSLPEYMVTCDASNANFASTLVAENPGIRTMQAWQEHFAVSFRRLIAWLLDCSESHVTFTWPEMVARDDLKLQQANAIKHTAGVLSTRTWQEQEHLDPERESKNSDAVDLGPE